MEDIKKNEDKNSIQLNENDIDFKTFLKYNNQILSYNPENIINKKNTEDLICSICYNILKNPISCSDKKNSHSFCKECIDKYLKGSPYYLKLTRQTKIKSTYEITKANQTENRINSFEKYLHYKIYIYI